MDKSLKPDGQRLFLVCPFCQMEQFITDQTGDAFFLTAPAAVFHGCDQDFFDSVKALIINEDIRTIYVAGDTSCAFMKNILAGKHPSGFTCETLLRELADEGDTVYSLTRKVVQHQVQQLGRKELLGEVIAAGNVSLHGLVTNKSKKALLTLGLTT